MIDMRQKTIFVGSFLKLITLTNPYTEISFFMLRNMGFVYVMQFDWRCEQLVKIDSNKLYFIPMFSAPGKYTQGGFCNENLLKSFKNLKVIFLSEYILAVIEKVLSLRLACWCNIQLRNCYVVNLNKIRHWRGL